MTSLSAAGVAKPPLWLIFGLTITGIMANTLISAAIPDILDDFGRSDGSAGLLVAVGPAPAIVLAPILGFAADRFGRRAVLVPALVLFDVGALVAATAPTFNVLLLGRFIQGMGGAPLIGLAITIIGDNWDGTDRAKFIGWNSAVLTVCVALFPALGGFITELASWRWAYAPAMFALLAAAAIALRLPKGGDPSTNLGERMAAARVALRTPVVITSTLMAFLIFVMIFGLFLTAFPLLLEDRFGLSAGQRGLVIVVPALTSTIASLMLGRMRSSLGARKITTIGTAMLVVSYVVVGWAPALALIVVASLVYGFAEGSAIPTLQDLVAGAAPPEVRGAVISVYVSVLRMGQTLGPLLVGFALTTIDAGPIFYAGALALVLAVGAQILAPPSAFGEDAPALSSR